MAIMNFFSDGWEALDAAELQTMKIQFQHMVENVKDRSKWTTAISCHPQIVRLVRD